MFKNMGQSWTLRASMLKVRIFYLLCVIYLTLEHGNGKDMMLSNEQVTVTRSRIVPSNLFYSCILQTFTDFSYTSSAWCVVATKFTSVHGTSLVPLISQIHRMELGFIGRKRLLLLCYICTIISSHPSTSSFTCCVGTDKRTAFQCNFCCVFCRKILQCQYQLHDSTASICLHYLTADFT